MKSDGFSSRLKEALGESTPYAFAKKCGISESLMRKYLAGESLPSVERAWAMAKSAGVSLDWLASGEAPSASLGGPKTGEHGDGADDYAYIPLYDARVSAGFGSWTEGAHVLAKLAFTRYSLRKKGLDPANLSAIRVSGDSNEPDLRDGDTVVLDHSRTAVDQEGYYVILLSDHLYAKRLQRQIGGGMAVISANPAYQTMLVAKEHLADLVIVGRVVWASRWMA